MRKFSMGENLKMYSENADTGYRQDFGTDTYIQYILGKYSETIIKLSYTYVKNTFDAEDIAQDVLLSLIKRNKPFESEEYERAWILRTTINKSKNHVASGWIKRTVSLEDTHDISDADTDDSAAEENAVMEAVLSLPEKYRTPIHLFYYDGYTINEIAEIIRKKPATVGTLLARGRALLKKMMIGGFDDEQVN